MEDKTEPAVCFSPSKKVLLEDLMTKKKSCIISNAFRSPDNQSVFINDYSKVVVPFELGFAQNVEDTTVPLSKVINEISVNKGGHHSSVG